MINCSSWTGAAKISCQIKKSGKLNKTWHLRWKPVCASTEVELSSWIKNRPLSTKNPRAFIAKRQSYGKGQRGRYWSSPKGGIWLSSAMPFDKSKKSLGLFGLAAAVTLANSLERLLIPVQIKWPNDLLVNTRKIAGLLPRIIYRGSQPVALCLGIGLNIANRVPKEGISLSEIISKENISLTHWYLEVLIAIEKAYFLLDHPETICYQGERLLWSKSVKKSDSGEIWDIEGLDLDGRLKVCRGLKKEIWNRWE